VIVLLGLLFHWSSYLSLYQYHVVFLTEAWHCDTSRVPLFSSGLLSLFRSFYVSIWILGLIILFLWRNGIVEIPRWQLEGGSRKHAS
jgi:nitrate reductase gamma subunit